MPGYVRYADDFLIFSDDRKELADIRSAVKKFLLPFRLKIHPHKSVVSPVRCGVPFLGYRLFPDHVRLARKHLAKLRQRLREFEQAYSKGTLSMDEAKASLQSWWGYAMHADCRTVVSAILSDFPFLQSDKQDRK